MNQSPYIPPENAALFANGDAPQWFVEWLNDKEAERDELIMRLRRIERLLIKCGRLKPQDGRPKRLR